MLEQHTVHLPEVVLRASGFGGFGGLHCVGMDLPKWKVPVDERQLLTESALGGLDQRIRARAVRALEVPVLDKDDACVEGSCDMIALADRNGQMAHDCTR